MDEDRKESGEEGAEGDSEDNLPSDSSNDVSDNTDMADTSGANDYSSANSNRLSGISLNGHVTRGRIPHNYYRFSNNPTNSPLPEWRDATDFGTSFSTASEMSLYQSALDLADMAKLDPRGSVTAENIPLSTNDMLEGIAEETTTPVTINNRMISFSDDLYMRDGVRRIDFVLAYDTTVNTSSKYSEIRKAFEDNLKEDGLQMEYECEDEKRVQFVKLHAPWEVLTRYAEIMKLKMPMKVFPDSLLEELCVDELFPDVQRPDKKISTHKFTSDVPGKIFQKFYNIFGLDPELFPPTDKRYTHDYSREKDYLFDIPTNKEDFFTPSQRSHVVSYILKRTHFSLGKKNDFSIGITKLLAEKVYTAAYPLHEGRLDEPIGASNPRGLLSAEWATLRKVYKLQPLDEIRNYLGVTFSLYFAWLGFYTYMLLPASLLGLICFIYGLCTMDTFIPSKDICEKGDNITMCPVCDIYCDYWFLNETCVYSRILYLFDNPSTVVFAVFMSFWSALFLEMWKRYSADITFRWDMSGFDQRELQPRPEYLARLAKNKKENMMDLFNRDEEPTLSFWKWKLPAVIVSFSVVLLMITVALAGVLGVIFYRMSVITALSFNEYGDAPRITSVTAAIINLFCIMILNQIYGRVAELLTEWEMHRTQTEFDDSLTLKMFMLQFINYYASIIYIAFFKGRFIGRPGNYNRLFGIYRQEECSTGGCLMELSIQLSIIMIGKQTLNTIVEIGWPMAKRMYVMLKNKIGKTKSYTPQTSWERDYILEPWQSQGLFWEYLEMVLQFGFVTIFVAAFPLAPLFALLNNCFEMRLDAKKILTFYQRPTGKRAKNIGIWFRILDGIGKLSVISNAFIIAFTSNFVPRLVYLFTVSKDGSLEGFLEHSLAYFKVSHFNVSGEYRPQYVDFEPDVCRYEDYRKPPDSKNRYEYTNYHWHVMAARLAFVVVFENVVVITVTLIRWLIPDVPRKLKERMRQEAYLINEIIVHQEFLRARGEVMRTNPRLLRFAQCDDPRSNHVNRSAANSVRKRAANNESIV